MKEIPLKTIEKAGFEIIENMANCYVSAPVDMESVEGGKLSDFYIGVYNTRFNSQEIRTEFSYTSFTILRNGVIKEFNISIGAVKEYFKKYFKDHPEEL